MKATEDHTEEIELNCVNSLRGLSDTGGWNFLRSHRKGRRERRDSVYLKKERVQFKRGKLIRPTEEPECGIGMCWFGLNSDVLRVSGKKKERIMSKIIP